MRTVMIRGLMMLWAGGLLAFLLAPTASADTIDCSAKVVDTTSAHVLDTAKVESAIRTVETHGADVYVRAFEHMPGGNADAFWAQGLQQCSNWRTPGGEPKANVIMVTFGMDRTMGIFFNASSFPSLNQSFGNIMSSDMKPNFRSEEFTAGITSALSSIAREIDPNKPAPTPTDYSGVGKVLLWILVGVVSAVGLVFATISSMRLYRRRQSRKAKRLSAQSKARQAKTRVAELLVGLDEPDAMKRGLLMASDGLPEPLVKKHGKELTAILDDFEQANDAYVELGRIPDGDPDVRLTTDRYQELEVEFTRIAESMESVKQRYDSLLGTVKADKEKLTREARKKQADSLDLSINNLSSVLDTCQPVFPVDTYQQKLQGYSQQLIAEQSVLDDDSKALESYTALAKLKEQLDGFSRVVSSLQKAHKKIVEVRQSVANEVNLRRSTLTGLQHVDSKAALRELKDAEKAATALARSLSPAVKHEDQVAGIDRSLERIRSAGRDAERRNQEAVDEQAREAKRKRQQEEDERRRAARRRSSSDFGSSFGGSMAGGYLGSSLGNSHSSSHSSDSSSSFGGGGGSWGGGGGDFGGGGGGW